ncbi:MAG: tyrosine-type recombinase/integrase [Sciscionella sp.]
MTAAVALTASNRVVHTELTQHPTRPSRIGPCDDYAIDAVMALLIEHADQLGFSYDRKRRIRRSTPAILEWLQSHPGEGWQQRWVAADAESRLDWLNDLPTISPVQAREKRAGNVIATNSLLLNRIVLPGYDLLAGWGAMTLYRDTLNSIHPELFSRIAEQAGPHGMVERRKQAGLKVLAKLVLHTGRNVDQLTSDDFDDYRNWGLAHNGFMPPGIVPAWDLLRGLEILPSNRTLKAHLHAGQRPTAELVDRYRLRCTAVRAAFIRYLDERRPGLDYVSFNALVVHLVGEFWADIEHHHPELDSLNVPSDVAAAWKQRVRFVTTKNRPPRPRKSYPQLLMKVRSLYLDIQEWALEEPYWAQHAFPSPVRRTETDGVAKQNRATAAAMHQRVRERLPKLPVLIETAERGLAAQQTLLEAARATPIGGVFVHDDVSYRRTTYKTYQKSPSCSRPDVVLVEHIETGEQTDVYAAEDDAFWTWAVIETLRHTGIRHEELLEITHLALVSYRLADTGELVPLLQILPSKNNQERLLLVSPELASVLATIITRLRERNGGTVPLVSRYDHHERTFGPMLPHLFQRRPRGHRNEVISNTTIQKLLDKTLARAHLHDATGEPLRFTPHDFRRLFATDAVTGGLPVHIAARLLGHQDLSTTQAYLAVFQDDLIRSYRAFLDHRRASRPEAEYREPTEDEWREFQRYFTLRKVALGTCGRPYGTPCRHEHSCIRCPMLRVDPRQRARLAEIIANLTERIEEAELHGWLGEKEGLGVSLQAARAKLAMLDRYRTKTAQTTTEIGIPEITTAR